MIEAGGARQAERDSVEVTDVARCLDCGEEFDRKPGAPEVCERCAEQRLISRFVPLYEVMLRVRPGDAGWPAGDAMNLLKAVYLIGGQIPEDVGGLPAWLRSEAAEQRRFGSEEDREGRRALDTWSWLEEAADWADAWLAQRETESRGGGCQA